MKIAIIASGFLPVTDGVAIALWYRLRYLSTHNHQVLLFCPDYSTLSDLYPDWQQYQGEIFPNVTVINLPSEPFLHLQGELNLTPRAYKIILNQLYDFTPDLLHIDEPERLWLGCFKRPGIDYAKQANIPCVSFFHTNFIEYLEDYLSLPRILLSSIQLAMRYHRNWIYNAYDLTLVSSTTTAQKLTNLGFKKVVNAQLLGVDAQKYQNQTKTANYFDKYYQIQEIEQKIKIILIGRLTPDKGWYFLLNSLTQLTKTINCDNLAWIIVGEGHLKEEIQARFTQFSLPCYFLGRISPEKIPSLLINSDIYLTTSEKETRGLTVLEAMAAGIPVIAPRAEGIIDSIQSGDNGLLFTPQSVPDFIAKLQTAINNPQWRRQIYQRRFSILQEYQWDQCVENLVTIWSSLIN